MKYFSFRFECIYRNILVAINPLEMKEFILPFCFNFYLFYYFHEGGIILIGFFFLHYKN